MQNDRPNKFVQFWKSKGYYMVLGLCAIAVAVAGYVFVSDSMAEKQELEQALSTAVTPALPDAQPETKTPETKAEPKPETETKTEPEASASAVQPIEDTVLPVSGAVVQDYAMDRLVYNATTQDWRVHNGVDLSAPLGQPVKAARAGTVTAVYEDDSYGVTVVLRHEGGWSSHYCGLAEEPSVAAGDIVTVGQTLGEIGTTAVVETAQEPHLHFEVYKDGEAVDPAGFLY